MICILDMISQPNNIIATSYRVDYLLDHNHDMMLNYDIIIL